MSVDFDGPRVVIIPLEKRYVAETVALATRVFITREPMTEHLGAAYEQIEPFMADLCATSVREGLGVVAVDESTGAIIGFVIGKDFTSPSAFVPEPRVAPIFDLLDRLDRAANLNARRGEVFEVMISGAAYPRRAGSLRGSLARGLGVEMVDAVVTTAAARGYRRVYTQCTSVRAERIALTLGGKLVTAIRYDEYVNDGERVFAGVGERRCAAYLRELASNG